MPPSRNTAFPSHQMAIMHLTLLLLNTTCPFLANSADPDEEANWSGSALFVIKYVNFYQKPGQKIWLAGN